MGWLLLLAGFMTFCTALAGAIRLSGESFPDPLAYWMFWSGSLMFTGVGIVGLFRWLGGFS